LIFAHEREGMVPGSGYQICVFPHRKTQQSLEIQIRHNKIQCLPLELWLKISKQC